MTVKSPMCGMAVLIDLHVVVSFYSCAIRLRGMLWIDLSPHMVFCGLICIFLYKISLNLLIKLLILILIESQLLIKVNAHNWIECSCALLRLVARLMDCSLMFLLVDYIARNRKL
ncbi:hypothetical protein HanPI659440_Chr16g0638571 [Helianthus annuus]|nr:hypothetical protein HanPI659440_Chr16g0638571 [Helianthus annuus]